jgi:hypothetical protein
VVGCPLAGKRMIDGHKIEELRPYIIGTCSECLKKATILIMMAS